VKFLAMVFDFRSLMLTFFSFLFFFFFTSAIFGFAFHQEFFNIANFQKSFENNKVYSLVRSYLVEQLVDFSPSELKTEIKSIAEEQITENYIKEELDKNTQITLAYLSSKRDSLDLYLNFSKLKERLSKDQKQEIQLISAALPDGLDFTDSLYQSGKFSEISSMRKLFKASEVFSYYSFVLFLLVLVPIFIFQKSLTESFHKIGWLFFSSSLFLIISSLILAFGSYFLFPFFLSSASSQSSNNLSKTVASILADIMSEVAIKTIIYSLPFFVFGLVLFIFFKSKEVKPFPIFEFKKKW